METEVTTTDQATGQEPQQESQSDSNVDFKALYLEEVQNSKKQRKAKQEAEKDKEAQKMNQMKEQGQLKELSEELQKRLDDALPYKERWENHENDAREKYLSKLPKADREKFANENLQVLEYMTDKLNESTAQPTQHKPGATRTVPIGKPWSEMSEEERRAMYDKSASEGWLKQ